MKLLRCHILLLLLAIAAMGPIASSSLAQTADTVRSLPGIEVQTSVVPGEMYVGDRVEYKLTVVYDSTYELIPPPIGVNLGQFEVKDYDADKITRLDDGRIQSENRFIISTFTTGDYFVPPVPVTFNLPDGTRKTLLAEAVPLKVKSLLEELGDSSQTEMRPLKPQAELEPDLTEYYAYGTGGALVTAVVIFLLLRWLRRRGKRELVDNRTPWERAFEGLAHLEQSDLLREGEVKEYYVELSEILRRYVARVYEIHVLEMTTSEFTQAFGEGTMPPTPYERCRVFLTQADLVKFAKFVPSRGVAESDLHVVHDVVEQIRVSFEPPPTPPAGAPDPAGDTSTDNSEVSR